jgi:hypothetical protein
MIKQLQGLGGTGFSLSRLLALAAAALRAQLQALVGQASAFPGRSGPSPGVADWPAGGAAFRLRGLQPRFCEIDSLRLSQWRACPELFPQPVRRDEAARLAAFNVLGPPSGDKRGVNC